MGVARRVAVSVAVSALMAPLFGTSATVAAPLASQQSNLAAACPDPEPGSAQCLAVRRIDVAARAAASVSPQNPPQGYSPSDLQSAYALPSMTAGVGSGMVVGIVDAYDLPTAESDLAVYRSQWGLSACTSSGPNPCFQQVDERGQPVDRTPGDTYYVAPDAGWGTEIALDIELVSAVCPNCRIVLVEAFNNSWDNLGTAVDRAVTMGAVAVSNSYVGPESPNTSTVEAHFTHPGVAITAASGDCGYDCVGTFGVPTGDHAAVGYPASSTHVIAVGGTRLTRDLSTARGWSEAAWGDAYGGGGSGCSTLVPRPSWQPAGVCGAYRSSADVSAVADPATGVAMYVTTTVEGVTTSQWTVEGGTSAASPIVAAAYGLAGGPTADYPVKTLYADPSGLFDAIGGNNDVTFHSCGEIVLCNALTGYDGPTGLGTPHGIGAFNAVATVPGKPTNLAASPGNASIRLSWAEPDNGGAAITSYTVTETPSTTVPCTMTGVASCTATGLTNGSPYTFTIHASNSVGAGPESDPSVSASPAAAAVPGKPTAVSGIGFAATATMSWTAPSDTGGSAIKGYTVTSSPDGKQCTTTGALTCSVTGLTAGRVYTFTVTATNDTGTGPKSDPSATVFTIGSTYHPMATPVRMLDSRTGNGFGGKLVANIPRTFQVGGRDVVPLAATAVTGNVTVTGETSSWAVFIGPNPTASPKSSTINFIKGDILANGVTVALSSTGSLSATFMAKAGNTTDLVFDVTGYFTPDDSGATYHRLDPFRIVDSRVGTGLTQKLVANTHVSFDVRLHGGVPAEATAVTGNVTVVNSTSSWAMYVGPDPLDNPQSSTINFKRGQIVANNVTVGLTDTGQLNATFISSAGNKTDLVFDVTGYYSPGLGGAKYVPLSPVRMLDTRIGNGLVGRLTANTPRSFAVGGRGLIPSAATAMSGNLTVTGQTSSWAIFAGPVKIAKPLTSTLNFKKGEVRANGLSVGLAGDGTLAVTYMSSGSNTTDLVLDVTGYYVP
jgi:hypothetical protein